jgi:predicted transcriptional regulator
MTASRINSHPIGENIVSAPDESDMVKSERKELVLRFMEKNSLALPPILVYRNLRLHRSLRVGKETVKNYLTELKEEGLVLRIDKQALDDGEIKEAEPDDRAYYIINDKGREFLRSKD